MSARDDVLARVRSALRTDGDGAGAGHGGDAGYIATDEATPGQAAPVGGVPAGGAPAGGVPVGDHDVVDLFVDRVADYRAVVVRCAAAEVAEAVRVGLADAVRVVVPAALPEPVAAGLEGREIVHDDPPLSAPDLDTVDAVVTTAALGIALTGTIVLDHGPGQGRRALSLVPDRHVCVVTTGQVVPDVPDAVRRLDPIRPLTWISGPSATSDIELDRVEGVHGPRNLHVIVVDAG